MNYDQLLAQLKKDLAAQGHGQLLPASLFGWLLTLLIVIAFVWGLFALYQVYSVWAARKAGQADLAEAQSEQQIQVAEARGRLGAAEMHKEAEIIAASAVAKSVEIIGTALHNNHGYLQWQWINMMQHHKGATVYVPTEASLPILEAGKRKDQEDI